MEIRALNDRYKDRKLLSQDQAFTKQGNSPEYEENGETQQRGERAGFGSNQGVDDLYLGLIILKLDTTSSCFKKYV